MAYACHIIVDTTSLLLVLVLLLVLKTRNNSIKKTNDSFLNDQVQCFVEVYQVMLHCFLNKTKNGSIPKFININIIINTVNWLYKKPINRVYKDVIVQFYEIIPYEVQLSRRHLRERYRPT